MKKTFTNQKLTICLEKGSERDKQCRRFRSALKELSERRSQNSRNASGEHNIEIHTTTSVLWRRNLGQKKSLIIALTSLKDYSLSNWEVSFFYVI